LMAAGIAGSSTTAAARLSAATRPGDVPGDPRRPRRSRRGTTSRLMFPAHRRTRSRARAPHQSHAQQGKAEFVQEIWGERFRSVLNCAKRSRDITKRDIERIDRTLKSLSAAAKASAAKPTPVPVPKPPGPGATPAVSPASVGLEAVRVRLERCCTSCRSTFNELLGIANVELAKVFQARHRRPANTEAGFELIDSTCGCSKCPPALVYALVHVESVAWPFSLSTLVDGTAARRERVD